MRSTPSTAIAVDTLRSNSPRSRRGDVEHERVEIVVLVLLAGELVMALAVRRIALRRRLLAEQDVGGKNAVARRGRCARPGDGPRRSPSRRAPARLVDKVGLGDDDEIGAAELILEQLLHRIVVLERKILGALLGELRLVGRDAAFRDRRRVDHGDDAVDGDA